MVDRSGYLVKTHQRVQDFAAMGHEYDIYDNISYLALENVWCNVAAVLKVTFGILLCFLSGHTEEFVCLCCCQGVTAGVFCPSVTERLWLPECDQPLVCLLCSSTPAASLAPATVLVARSFNPRYIWVWSAGNLLCPIRSSCQLGFPFILAHLLSDGCSCP